MFHVEISTGAHRARVFNLDRDDLLAKLVDPWLAGRPVLAGEREWQPRESRLRILEGPRMENADLSFGQGWANAERRSEEVTRRLLEREPAPPPEAFAIEAGSAEELAALLAGAGARRLPLAEAEERLGGRDPEVAAVVLVVRRAGPGDRKS